MKPGPQKITPDIAQKLLERWQDTLDWTPETKDARIKRLYKEGKISKNKAFVDLI